MKKLIKNLLILSFVAISLVACSKENQKKNPDEKTTLNLSAAASLEQALKPIISEYEKTSGNSVNVNLAGSGTLQKQIQEKAPVDIFISAGKKQMDLLNDKGLISESENLLENSLVIVSNKENPVKLKSIEDLKNIDGKIAVAELETVPVGNYTKESLDYYKIFDQVKDKLVYGKDVKATLNMVDTKEVDVGFVYLSDAETDDLVEVSYEIDPKSHSKILYPMGKISYSENSKEKDDLYEYLKSDRAREEFERAGFKIFNGQ